MTELWAVTTYALRACLPRRRQIGVFILGIVALLFGLLTRTLTSTPASAFAETGAAALFGLVLPLIGLVAGDAVMGAEVRRGTFHFTWISPAPTWAIAGGRWLGGFIVTAAVAAPSFAAAAFIAGAPSASAWSAAVAAVAGSAAYVAVFVAIATVVRRAPRVSLAFVFIGERLLGTAMTSIAQISPMWESRSLFLGWAPAAHHLQRKGIPGGGSALVRLMLITAVALAVATWRLRAMKIETSSAD